jgi:chemotaxis protein CheD
MLREKSGGCHFLMASSIFAERTPAEVQTVLGSCVSVCLFDTRNCFGGMNHYMLPLWNGEGLATAKYGNIAIDKLLDRLISLGSDKKDLFAKVFGGAETLGDNAIYGIGKRNVLIAEDQLAAHGIPILASNVGGKVGRQIVFDTSTGLVYMKFIKEK